MYIGTTVNKNKTKVTAAVINKTWLFSNRPVDMSDIFAQDFFRRFGIDIFEIDIEIFVGNEMS